MSEHPPFTIEQFYKYVNEGKLMGGKCRRCGTIYVPSRPLCGKCFSEEFEWIEIPRTGKLLTYTTIYVAPPQFQEMTPYSVGIAQLENGSKIPGMMRSIEHEEIKIGMPVTVKFEESAEQSQWPPWPRYYLEKCDKHT